MARRPTFHTLPRTRNTRQMCLASASPSINNIRSDPPFSGSDRNRGKGGSFCYRLSLGRERLVKKQDAKMNGTKPGSSMRPIKKTASGRDFVGSLPFASSKRVRQGLLFSSCSVLFFLEEERRGWRRQLAIA